MLYLLAASTLFHILLTSVTMREFFPRLSLRGACKLTIDKTRMPRTYKMMVAESPTNFQPLNIVNHYCAVFEVLGSGMRMKKFWV